MDLWTLAERLIMYAYYDGPLWGLIRLGGVWYFFQAIELDVEHSSRTHLLVEVSRHIVEEPPTPEAAYDEDAELTLHTRLASWAQESEGKDLRVTVNTFPTPTILIAGETNPDVRKLLLEMPY